MSGRRYAFIKVSWHAEIGSRARASAAIGDAEIAVFDAPGA
jgi:hypothetical protein